jgi:hypothetical protein
MTRALTLLALVLSCAPPTALAEDESSESSAAQLADEFSDPLTTLPQVFLKDVYTPATYGASGSINRVVARLIVPRLPVAAGRTGKNGAASFTSYTIVNPFGLTPNRCNGNASYTASGFPQSGGCRIPYTAPGPPTRSSSATVAGRDHR